jgi:signal transduction histidine kinase
MRQGGRLVVRAHDTTDNSNSRSKGRHGIRITIADTGHGMSSEVRARLFEPFYTTKDLNGTGLGLWISAGIVQRHQGRITFRSTQHPIHHGTIFSLFLPWAEESSPPVAQ